MTFTEMEEQIACKDKKWKTKEEFEAELKEWMEYNRRKRKEKLEQLKENIMNKKENDPA